MTDRPTAPDPDRPVLEVVHTLHVPVQDCTVSDLIAATSEALIAGVPTTARVTALVPWDTIKGLTYHWSTPPEPLPGRLQALAATVRWRTAALLELVRRG